MRKIIVNLAVTLDGYIEGAQGEIDWCILEEDMDFSAFITSVDSIFFGRISYDLWGQYQPDQQASAAEKHLWELIHSKNKYVFSHQSNTDHKATFIQTDIAREVAAIKEQSGKDIWLYGGASLIRCFIKLGLIDVFKRSVHPVVLGSGKPLFEGLKERMTLTLTNTRMFQSGVVELTYHKNP